jgi:hypothetical protein
MINSQGCGKNHSDVSSRYLHGITDPSGRAVYSVGLRPACFLGLRVRFPLGAWMFVCSECCVLSGGGLCVGPITHPEGSYRMGVSECDREASTMRWPWPTRNCRAIREKNYMEALRKTTNQSQAMS